MMVEDLARRRRVPPNPSRPRLSPTLEAAFADTDQRSASAYDLAERAIAQLRALRVGLERGAVTGSLDCSDSAVVAIERAKPPEKP